MTREEEIEESEKIRKAMNDGMKKSLQIDHDMHPFFTQKPSFYYDMALLFKKGDKK